MQLPESSVAFIYQEKGQRCDSENEEVSIEEHDDHEGQVLLGDLAGHEEEAREHDSHQGGVEGDSSESITAAAASGRSRNSGSCNGNGSRRKRSGEGGDTGGNTGNAAAIQAIKNGLLMIPVDLEELRNFAWKEGGYQVRGTTCVSTRIYYEQYCNVNSVVLLFRYRSPTKVPLSPCRSMPSTS